jgi:hypothetical protein
MASLNPLRLALVLSGAAVAFAQSPLWGQCGGQGWSGPTTCVSGSVCVAQNQWYSQCIPGDSNPPPATTTTTGPTPTTTGGGGTPAQSVAALYTVDPSLPGHTIYRPQNMNAFAKMPVLVWGNGACSADGLSHVNFNLEIASWGVIVIAQGEPRQGGSTNANQMKQAIDWAKNNAGKGTYTAMDASRLAAAGMSCGGTEALAMVPDSRVTAYGIFNSGNLDAGSTNRIIPQINVPIFFFLGGPSDIAYGNGMRDYAAVRSGVPSWVGNLPVGHGGTYGDPKGGKFGTAAQQYFRWVLRGDTSAAAFFTGNGGQSDGWTVERKSLNNVNPGTPW